MNSPSVPAPWVSFLSAVPTNKRLKRWLLVLGLLLCAVGNLPWQLDNYDQAKQAYVSYEIAQGGSWWFQHTPRGDTATKPPLAGWISWTFYEVTHSWNVAWRLPGYLGLLVLLALLMHEARRILPAEGALLVLSALMFNLLTPRIATLVRTDLLLTLWITLCGWLIYRKVRSGEPWRRREKILFFLAMTAALLTKGPILYVFIVPGLLVFLLWAPKSYRPVVWSGWWTWVLPLALFLAWGIAGLLANQEFYHDVVVRELFSRFDQSLKHETQQPVWFYFPHLLHKFAPWSLLVIALPLASANIRQRIKTDPGTFWLVCWALGGLLCMTAIPSKRVDRIFPVIPPLCLLLVEMIAACRCGEKVRAWCGAATIVSVLMTTGYFVTIITVSYLHRDDALVRFGQEVQRLAHERGATQVGVVGGRDEGLVIYCDGGSYLHPNKATRLWNEKKLDAVVIPQRLVNAMAAFPPPALDSGAISKQGEVRYLLFLRPR